MHVINGMKIKAKRNEVLGKLHGNREKHISDLAEAKAGYLKAAEIALTLKVSEIRAGNAVSLDFDDSPPHDYTSVYDTVITMLELSCEDEIELTDVQVRHLVMDQWDWKSHFTESIMKYAAPGARRR